MVFKGAKSDAGQVARLRSLQCGTIPERAEKMMGILVQDELEEANQRIEELEGDIARKIVTEHENKSEIQRLRLELEESNGKVSRLVSELEESEGKVSRLLSVSSIAPQRQRQEPNASSALVKEPQTAGVTPKGTAAAVSRRKLAEVCYRRVNKPTGASRPRQRVGAT